MVFLGYPTSHKWYGFGLKGQRSTVGLRLTAIRRGFELYECLLVIVVLLLLLPAGSAAGSSAGISFTHGPILGFFAPQGRHVAPIKVKFGREEGTEGPLLPAMPNLTLIGSGVGVYGPQNWKKSKFTNIIAPKGRVPCTIITKFTSFMRVLSLHNFAKYGCFISTNDKIINNLLRLGRFQSNFRHPLAAKLWMGPQKV